MSKGIKLLITGMENSGKTTLTSTIEDGMVVVVDAKHYPFKKPHYRVDEYEGIVDFKNTIINKIKSYKTKHGKLPRTIILDTITKMYELMYMWSEENFKGFDKFNAISRETLMLNKIIENTLIAKGMNVVIVAHVQYDQNTNKYVVPAVGKFKDTGSWLSVVDEASYVHILGNDRYISHKELKYPCRSTLGIEESQLLSTYNINDHIAKLESNAVENEAEVL